MGHRVVNGEGLRTTYSASPSVTVNSTEDGPVSVRIVFQAEPSPLGAMAKFTILTFGNVLEYRWVASNFTYFMANPDDYAFGLIEIIDSQLLEMMAANGMYKGRPEGMRLGGIIREEDVRHFRIGFDHYGTIDILCLALEIAHTVQVSGT